MEESKTPSGPICANIGTTRRASWRRSSRSRPTTRPATAIRPPKRSPGLLEGLGFAVERHKVPDALVEANGMVSATNLIVRRKFGQGGPTIALNAHGDVVPPGDGWTHNPYGAEIVDGWLYGRGAAVSKSDIATYAFAILALDKSGAALDGTVELHVTYDEEAGGEIGPRYILHQGLSKPDLAIAAGFSYAVVTAHNGCLHLEVRFSAAPPMPRAPSPASTRSRLRTAI